MKKRVLILCATILCLYVTTALCNEYVMEDEEIFEIATEATISEETADEDLTSEAYCEGDSNSEKDKNVDYLSEDGEEAGSNEGDHLTSSPASEYIFDEDIDINEAVLESNPPYQIICNQQDSSIEIEIVLDERESEKIEVIVAKETEKEHSADIKYEFDSPEIIYDSAAESGECIVVQDDPCAKRYYITVKFTEEGRIDTYDTTINVKNGNLSRLNYNSEIIAEVNEENNEKMQLIREKYGQQLNQMYERRQETENAKETSRIKNEALDTEETLNVSERIITTKTFFNSEAVLTDDETENIAVASDDSSDTIEKWSLDESTMADAIELTLGSKKTSNLTTSVKDRCFKISTTYNSSVFDIVVYENSPSSNAAKMRTHTVYLEIYDEDMHKVYRTTNLTSSSQQFSINDFFFYPNREYYFYIYTNSDLTKSVPFYIKISRDASPESYIGTPDSFEPNDYIDEACNIGNPGYGLYEADYSGNIHCDLPTDYDLFLIEMPEEGGIEFYLSAQTDDDWCVCLCDENMNLVAIAETETGETDCIECVYVDAGIYYLEVSKWNGASDDVYELTICCMNYDDYPDEMIHLSNIVSEVGYLSGGYLEDENDIDWLSYHVYAPNDIEMIYQIMIESDMDIDTVLYDADGNIICDIFQGNINNCVLPPDQWYFIKISSTDGSTGEYDVNFIGDIDNISQDIDGDTTKETYALKISGVTNYCEDNDYAKFIAPTSGEYVFRLEKGEKVSILVYNAEDIHDVDLSASLSSVGSEATVFLEQGTSHIVEFTRESGYTAIDFEVSINFSIIDDAGNSIEFAEEITNPYDGQTANINYDDDVDFFKIIPGTSGSFLISAIADGKVLINVYNEDGTSVSGKVRRGSEGKIYSLSKGKSYYIKVSGVNGEYNLYYEDPLTVTINVE